MTAITDLNPLSLWAAGHLPRSILKILDNSRHAIGTDADGCSFTYPKTHDA